MGRPPEKGIHMRHLAKQIGEFLAQEDGPTAVEYAVMLALIILVAIGGILSVGQASCSNFNSPKISSALQSGS